MNVRPMNKSDIILAARERFGMQADMADNVVSWFFDLIGDTVAQGRQVSVKGFGSFSPKHRAGREGVNPRTGTPIYIQPKAVVAFRPGRELAAKMVKG